MGHPWCVLSAFYCCAKLGVILFHRGSRSFHSGCSFHPASLSSPRKVPLPREMLHRHRLRASSVPGVPPGGPCNSPPIWCPLALRSLPLWEALCHLPRVDFKATMPGDTPGGSVGESPPANTGDAGSIPGPGRSHMPQND